MTYQRYLSLPKEYISMLKSWLRTFVCRLKALFRNPRWPPAAILDLCIDSKIVDSSFKWHPAPILTIFGHIAPAGRPVQRRLCSINQSLAAILKINKWPKWHTRGIYPCPTNLFPCLYHDRSICLSSKGTFLKIQDGRRQPYWICAYTQKQFIPA